MSINNYNNTPTVKNNINKIESGIEYLVQVYNLELYNKIVEYENYISNIFYQGTTYKSVKPEYSIVELDCIAEFVIRQCEVKISATHTHSCQINLKITDNDDNFVLMHNTAKPFEMCKITQAIICILEKVDPRVLSQLFDLVTIELKQNVLSFIEKNKLGIQRNIENAKFLLK